MGAVASGPNQIDVCIVMHFPVLQLIDKGSRARK